MKKLLLSLCISAAMLMSAALAQAAVIYDWSYSATASLTDMQFSTPVIVTAPGPSTVGGAINGGYAEYRWGQNDDVSKNSGLRVEGHNSTVTANGVSSAGITITHYNKPVTMGVSTLEGGTISASITFSAGAGASYTVNTSLSFSFFETPNELEDSSGAAIPTEFTDDIFFMTASEVMKSVGSFVHDGERYVVSLQSSLQPLTGEYLRMAQEAGNYSSDTILYGWTTKEDKDFTNNYELSLTVTHAPVPVPGAVWLMGTGLAGLVGLRRRNRS